jgi:AcrR family transcriptional regulator
VKRKSRSAPAIVQAETRDALLEAAAEVFAERGFNAATVRHICQRAGANIAAVSYHFGDKEQLYAEVLKHALHAAHEKYPPTLGLPKSAPPEAKLRAFIESFLLRIFDDGRHSWHGKLMSREMIEPTAALDSLVEEEIRPMSDNLHEIVRELMDGADEQAVRLCAMSVVSQCVFYQHCRPVLSRLFPKMKLGAQVIRNLAEHITEFSLAALAQYSGRKPSIRGA